MNITLQLDEQTAAGRAGLQLLQVRQQIGAALRVGSDPHVVELLRLRERVLSDHVVAALAESGGLLDAVVGRVGMAREEVPSAAKR